MDRVSSLPFGFDHPEDSPGFLLWQVTTVWQREIRKALDPFGISHPQFVIMAITLWLAANGYDTTQTLITIWSKLDKMTVSQSLRKLESLGLVHRSSHKKDPRAKQVILTDCGQNLLKRLIPIVENFDKQFFGSLLESTLHHFQESLKTLLSKGDS